MLIKQSAAVQTIPQLLMGRTGSNLKPRILSRSCVHGSVKTPPPPLIGTPLILDLVVLQVTP